MVLVVSYMEIAPLLLLLVVQLCLSMDFIFRSFENSPQGISKVAFQASAQCGDTVTICTTKPIGSATRYIYDHVRNEPGSEGTPMKIIVSTWNHTLHVDDHIKKRWRLNPVSGESETIMRTVPRTQMIKSYFSSACQRT